MTPRLTRRTTSGFAILAGALILAPATTSAQGFPSKPITLIVPFAAGGPSDVIARLVGEHMGRTLGQQVIVENKPGAGSVLGTDFVAKSAPDGYTLLIATGSTHSIGRWLLVIHSFRRTARSRTVVFR